MIRGLLIIALAVLISPLCVCAADWEPLWPNGAPESKGDAEHDTPALLSFPAAKESTNGCAVLVCPGGGYGGLAMDHEGHQIAA